MSSQGNGADEWGAEAASAIKTTSSRPSTAESLASSETEGMKRAAAKQYIEKYYYQLTDGCGDAACTNQFCASSPNFCHKSLSKNEAAVQALELFKQKAKLCDSQPSKVPKPGNETDLAPSTSKENVVSATVATTAKPESKPVQVSTKKEIPYLTEEKIMNLIATCKETGSWSILIRAIGEVYNNPQALCLSFLKTPVTKEQIRSMEVDADKDEDEGKGDGHIDDKADDSSQDEADDSEKKQTKCTEPGPSGISEKEQISTEKVDNNKQAKGDDIDLDMEGLSRVYDALFSIPNQPFQASLINAIIYLSRDTEMVLRYRNNQLLNDRNFLNIFFIVMEIPALHSPEYLEVAFPTFCKAMGLLPLPLQAKIVRIWSKFDTEFLRKKVEALQQLITVKIITGAYRRAHHTISDDEMIEGATKVLKLVYFASIYGGRMDPPEVVAEEKAMNQELEVTLQDLLQGAVGHEPKEHRQPKQDDLAQELRIQVVDCRQPKIPAVDFINDVVNEHIEMDKDFTNYKSDSGKFSFFSHPFILSTATKNLGMYYDNRIRMINERRTSLLQSLVHGAPTMPYLRLRIRRDHVIDDALVGLEMAAMDNPQDLKKQLYVEFEGEQGLDEGGVSKEFFQLVVEEIFNPDFGMFVHDEKTRRVWFNPTSFENDAQFTLIGIILGLAIYNNIILDINFPMVVYRKLMGKKGVFEDMFDSHPVMAHSLQDVLDYDGSVEEDFLLNFHISFQDVFGSNVTHILKDGGGDIPVTNENSKEYVDLYADYILNKSIEKQFSAFKRGFQMVTDESPLRFLFRPEEVELLVCGSQEFNFTELEEATDYDGGFNVDSRTIKNFWEVVHAFPVEQKRQLLQFTTGSDRVPVGGLSKLKLIIARNGPDSERLPTAHTCFNVLLLPDYNTKEKLKERLLKAITYAKGFGML